MDKSPRPYVFLQHTYLIMQRFLLWKACDKTGIKLLMFITAIVAVYAKQQQKNINHSFSLTVIRGRRSPVYDYMSRNLMGHK